MNPDPNNKLYIFLLTAKDELKKVNNQNWKEQIKAVEKQINLTQQYLQDKYPNVI